MLLPGVVGLPVAADGPDADSLVRLERVAAGAGAGAESGVKELSSRCDI